jgi:hypothetical protein
MSRKPAMVRGSGRWQVTTNGETSDVEAFVEVVVGPPAVIRAAGTGDPPAMGGDVTSELTVQDQVFTVDASGVQPAALVPELDDPPAGAWFRQWAAEAVTFR